MTWERIKECNLVKVIAQKHGNDGKWYVHTETHKILENHNFEQWLKAITTSL